MVGKIDEEHTIQIVHSLKWFSKNLKVVHFCEKNTQELSRKFGKEIRHLHSYSGTTASFVPFLLSMNSWSYKSFSGLD